MQCELHPKSVEWLFGLCYTGRVFIDYWSGCATGLRSVNRLQLFWYLKDVYWLSSVSYTHRVLADCLVCAVYCTWRVFTDYLMRLCNKTEECQHVTYLFFSVPEECLLFIWWYCAMKLKSVNGLLLFWKSVYWLSSVSCTQRVLNDCLVCILLEGCSLIIWWCAMKLKTVDRTLLFWYLKSVYWLSSVNNTQRVLTDCLVCVVPEECSLII